MRGPTVNFVTNSTAMIYWVTSDPTNSTVQYGLAQNTLSNAESSTDTVTEHRVWLSGLEAGTRYYYKVISNGTESDTYNFKTAPPDGQPFKMIVLGDNRPGQDTAPTQPQVFSEIIDLVTAEDPDIVVMTGDYVYSLTSDDKANENIWEHFTNITDRLGHYVPIYGVIGNHDIRTPTGVRNDKYFLEAFEMPDEPKTYGSFDFAGVHFILLDTEQEAYEGRIAGPQWDWLVNDLTQATEEMKFVFAHRPLYPLRHIGSALDVNKDERADLQQLLEDTNVTAFFAGHDHLYNRLTVNGVVHIITGGAGAPPYETPWGGAFYHYLRVEVSPQSVNFTAVRADGTVAETYSLPDRGPIEIEERVYANNTQVRPGVVPEIYFSRVPVAKLFSWDGGANSTEPSAIPAVNGEHYLDVYVRDEDGVWSHARFVYTVVGAPNETTSSTTESTTATGASAFVPAIAIGVAVAVVVVVVVVGALRRRRAG